MKHIDRMNALADGAASVGEDVGFQKCADLFFLALIDEGWGEERLKKIFVKVHELQAEYNDAYKCKPESDWLQERMDGKLKRACGAAFVPFAQRNPYIKQFNYRRVKGARKD